MEQLIAKHPDMKNFLRDNPSMQTYKILRENDSIIEAWEKDENGHWVDVTEREKLKERISREKDEIETLNTKLRRNNDE